MNSCVRVFPGEVSQSMSRSPGQIRSVDVTAPTLVDDGLFDESLAMPSHGYSSSSAHGCGQGSFEAAIIPHGEGDAFIVGQREVSCPLFFFKLVHGRPSKQKRIQTYLGSPQAGDMAITLHAAAQVSFPSTDAQANAAVSVSPVSGTGRSSSVLLWPFPRDVPHATLLQAFLRWEAEQPLLVSLREALTSCSNELVQALLGRMLDQGAIELDDSGDLFASGLDCGYVPAAGSDATAELNCLQELQVRGVTRSLAVGWVLTLMFSQC